MGQTIQRLIAKYDKFRTVGSTSAALAPLQLGYEIQSGCEAVVHTARLYLTAMSSGQAIVKVDFKNTFNSLRRDKILEAVRDTTPEL